MSHDLTYVCAVSKTVSLREAESRMAAASAGSGGQWELLGRACSLHLVG